MATYSLICWGGLTGKSVTASNSSGLIFTTALAHGLIDANPIRFTATTLPGNVAANTTYYVKVLTTTTFSIYTEDTLTNRVAWSSAGTAVYAKSAYFLTSIPDYTRYGGASTTDPTGARIFDSIASCRSSRYSNAGALELDVWEIAEKFIDTVSVSVVLNTPAASTLVTPTVDGVYTSAYHSGTLGAGYVVKFGGSYTTIINISGYRNTVEDININNTGTTGNGGCSLSGGFNTIQRCFVYGNSISSNYSGIAIGGAANAILNCVVKSFATGIGLTNYQNQSGLIANNTCVGNTTGFAHGGSSTYGFIYNNASVGNTTNWGTTSSYTTGAGFNGGLSTDTPWFVGTDTGIKTLTADNNTFADYAGDDFRPVSDNTRCRDTGRVVVGMTAEDLNRKERPNYNNGGTEAWDIGAFEYQSGFTRPATQYTTVSGVASGSRIKIALQSDGTEIYNSLTAPSAFETNYSSATPVYLYIRKGSAATYYHPLKLSATIDPVNGLTYDTTGLQQIDIAAHDYSATAVASDWTFNSGTGAITHASGTTRYNVQDLYSWHQDYYDDSATVSSLPLMHGTTSRIFELLNGGTITSTDLQALKGGSILFGNGDLWSNLWTTDTMAAAHSVYVVQGTSKYTAFWGTGPIDVLLQVSDAGTLRSSGLVDVYARPYGYTYAYYQADLSGGGRNVAPIATLVDATCTAIDPSGFTDVTYTFSTTSHDFGDVHGAQTYYCVIDCNNRPLSEVFARTMYDCRDVSTTTLNGVLGWRYQSAHAGYTANALAPFGMYSGGIWTVAKGVWLSNVQSGDLVNYILTDDAGHTHQNTVALNQSVTVAGLVVGSQVQIYDVTNATELVNQTASTSVVTWEDPSAPTGDREIRLRVGYLGKLFIDQIIGTCGTSSSTKDVSYLASQQTDTVYVNNALDGSAMTNITVDATIPRIKVDESGGSKTWPMIYAYLRYYQATAAGIAAANIGCISATDTANYFLDDANGWKVRSINANPLSLTGGWARGSTAGTVASIIDATGSTGSIFVEPDHVVAYQTTGTYAITGDISTVLAAIPSAADNTSAIFAQAGVTPMPGNVKEVNDVTVTGTGTTLDPWNPA